MNKSFLIFFDSSFFQPPPCNNIEFLKFQTKENSSIIIGSYEVNLNSRILKLQPYSVSLTEKEINLIMFLNSSNSSVNVAKLQSDVWSYRSNLESHTVETHIYRLRKKIKDKFNDSNFVISHNEGYLIWNAKKEHDCKSTQNKKI